MKPFFSHGELLVSKRVPKRLLTHFKVHPGFLDILHTFGEKTQEDKDFGIYKQYITNIQGERKQLASAFGEL